MQCIFTPEEENIFYNVSHRCSPHGQSFTKVCSEDHRPHTAIDSGTSCVQELH